MNCSRRELGLLIPALAAAAADPAGQPLPSKVYSYDELPVKTNGQNQSRAVLNGETHSGFAVELHMTTLGPGQAPHAPHHHVHEEIVMLRRGTLEVTIAGRTSRAGAGSVIYVASGEEHGMKNAGTEPAEYFVIALGGSA